MQSHRLLLFMQDSICVWVTKGFRKFCLLQICSKGKPSNTTLKACATSLHRDNAQLVRFLSCICVANNIFLWVCVELTNFLPYWPSGAQWLPREFEPELTNKVLSQENVVDFDTVGWSGELMA